MRRILPLLCALGFCLTNDSIAQNEIDYVNSYYWSGYGKMEIDRDTLYLNSMNGAGVERYYIADPAHPQFIDRTHVSGFDQIDFGRRLMADFIDGELRLVDISNFENPIVLSEISPVANPEWHRDTWKMVGDHIFTLVDDTIRSFDISDPLNPTFIGSCRLRMEYMYSEIIFGTTVLVVAYWDPSRAYLDIYDMRQPDSISFSDSLIIALSGTGSFSLYGAGGDTMVTVIGSFMGQHSFLTMRSFAPNDTSTLPEWPGFWPPPSFEAAGNGFIIKSYWGGGMAYLYDDFTPVGIVEEMLSANFEFASNDYLILAAQDSLTILQPTYSNTEPMPQVNSIGPSHHGFLSTAAYGNYILSGAESNGGELLVHELSQNGQLSLAAALPGVAAKEIIIDGATAFCLCPNMIAAVDISNPENPSVIHDITGFSGALTDFAMADSFLFVVTDRAYGIVQYDDAAGFVLRGTLDLPGGTITSIVHYSMSYVLKGNLGTVIKINPNFGGQPHVMGEYRLPHENYRNLDLGQPGLWASGPNGTDIVSLWALDSVYSFGPEYFSDARNFYFSGDTLIVADGFGGIKIYNYRWSQFDSLRYLGGYSTGNQVTQIAQIGNNFFLSDYYSLHHLRWGAPTDIAAETETGLPSEITLLQNFPNPFNTQTTIEFALARAGDVRLDVFDVLGRRVATLFEGVKSAGRHRVVWDAGELPSGVYLYRLATDDHFEINGCVLIK